MSIDKEEVVIPAACQGMNCGTTTCEHSAECLAETARDQVWDQFEAPEVVGVTDTFDIIWNQPIGSTIADGTELMTVAQYRAHMAALIKEIESLRNRMK